MSARIADGPSRRHRIARAPLDLEYWADRLPDEWQGPTAAFGFAAPVGWGGAR
ncbi:hypothetical protein [Nocardia pneumoniae]|uniref:hypothetical protein n=1 Tax=Nocardia pneumoniae TaxID=228601 RepID=UPI0002F77C32|nr:hypothetical protein [Nocardia pneumoniae]